MRVTICYYRGFEVEGVVLSAAGGRLRVAVQGCPDAAEFELREGYWFSESGEPVQLDLPWAEEARRWVN